MYLSETKRRLFCEGTPMLNLEGEAQRVILQGSFPKPGCHASRDI